MSTSSSVLRARGSPVRRRKSQTRSKPQLSPDGLSQHFFVRYQTDNADLQNEVDWEPHQVRFILWYHYTTTLSESSIAIAFNITFGPSGIQMDNRNVRFIIDNIKLRFPLFKDELIARGHWPKPTYNGWSPCDHGMCCAGLAEASLQSISVMRSSTLKYTMERDIVEMATTIWDGSWEEILSCPRYHPNPSSPSSTSSSGQSLWSDKSLLSIPSNENSGRPGIPRWAGPFQQRRPMQIPIRDESWSPPAVEITPPSSGSSSAIRIHQDRVSPSEAMSFGSCRSQNAGSIHQDRASSSLAKSVRSSENPSPFLVHRDRATQPRASSVCSGKIPRPRTIPPDECRPAGAWPAKSGISIVRRAKSQSSAGKYVPPRAMTPFERSNTIHEDHTEGEVGRRGRFGTMTACVGGWPAFWLLLQQTILNMYWCFFLRPYFELASKNFEDLRNHHTRLSRRRCCELIWMLFGARVCIDYSLQSLCHFRRRRGTGINSPDAAGLCAIAYFFHWTISGMIAVFVCHQAGPTENAMGLLYRLVVLAAIRAFATRSSS